MLLHHIHFATGEWAWVRDYPTYHNFTSITTYSIALARAESHAALAVRNDPAEVKRRRAIARRACKRKEWDNTRRRTTPWQRYVRDRFYLTQRIYCKLSEESVMRKLRRRWAYDILNPAYPHHDMVKDGDFKDRRRLLLALKT